MPQAATDLSMQTVKILPRLLHIFRRFAL
jgi:hypothetical protein